MKKENVKWGLIIVLIFIIISVILLNLPCKPVYMAGGFFGAICNNDLWFIIINLVGAIISSMVINTDLAVYQHLPSIILSIIINVPLYYLFGIIIRKLIKGEYKNK